MFAMTPTATTPISFVSDMEEDMYLNYATEAEQKRRWSRDNKDTEKELRDRMRKRAKEKSVVMPSVVRIQLRCEESEA